MGDINKMIQWMKDREGKVTYSQTNRLGPQSYDCSSAVYFSLAAGGFIPSGSMGWTLTLHDMTLPPITKKISRSECKRGDIFLSKYWANEGHTGIFIDNSTIIHCSYGRNGIYTTPAAGGYMGEEPIEYYRLNNTGGSGESSGLSGDIQAPCFIEMNNGISWFDGKKRHNLPHKDCQEILNEIYRKNNGKDVPVLKLKGADEAWLVRLDQAINAKS